MKIISLNIWGGRAGKEKLLEFFRKYKNTIDVFCLQEVWSAPHKNLEGKLAGGVPLNNAQIMTEGVREISNILVDHIPYFRPHLGDNYGIIMFVRKGIEVIEEGEEFVHGLKGYLPEGDLGNHPRNIQFATLRKGKDIVTVINFHGLWNGKGKTDSEDRLSQSNKIADFIKRQKHGIVLCGDFNLLPETESLKIVEKTGLRNLINEYGITSTRTSYYMKPIKFADYAFISDDIKVKDFRILPEEVSDHAPLLIEITF